MVGTSCSDSGSSAGGNMKMESSISMLFPGANQVGEYIGPKFGLDGTDGGGDGYIAANRGLRIINCLYIPRISEANFC